ncbi:MAG: 50S ribosomal protein L25/general stress protein Ctc [Galactobacter sp.]
MSDYQTIHGEVRTDFGKGAARQARRAEKIPAVIYGHGGDPVHVLLPARETTLAVRTSNAILNIEANGKEGLVLVKDIQRHPLRQSVDHLDLLTIKKGEKVSVEVNVHVTGEPFASQVASLDVPTIAVLADALNLPDFLVANVEGLADAHITAGDLELPKGAELEIDAETVVVTVSEPVEVELPEAPAADEAGEAAEAPAE